MVINSFIEALAEALCYSSCQDQILGHMVKQLITLALREVSEEITHYNV